MRGCRRTRFYVKHVICFLLTLLFFYCIISINEYCLKIRGSLTTVGNHYYKSFVESGGCLVSAACRDETRITPSHAAVVSWNDVCEGKTAFSMFRCVRIGGCGDLSQRMRLYCFTFAMGTKNDVMRMMRQQLIDSDHFSFPQTPFRERHRWCHDDKT